MNPPDLEAIPHGRYYPMVISDNTTCRLEEDAEAVVERPSRCSSSSYAWPPFSARLTLAGRFDRNSLFRKHEGKSMGA